jgi:hypothetical protein
MKPSQSKARDLVPQNQSPQVPATPANPCDIFHDPDGAGVFWSSLDPSDPEHAWIAQEIGNAASTTIDQYIGKSFKACHIYINRWSTTDDETGEYISGIRVTLIGPKMEFLSFTGNGAIRALQRICSNPCVGLPPWENGIALQVGQVTEGKKRRHTLSIAREDMVKLIADYNAKNGKKR